METKDNDRGQGQAKAQLDSIKEMVKVLRVADEDSTAYDDAMKTIYEDPLSVEVRTSWHTPGTKGTADEYMILLCTGGPACRITGELNEYGEPETAQIEYQDWFTAWERYNTTDKEDEILLEYAKCFYYGEE